MDLSIMIWVGFAIAAAVILFVLLNARVGLPGLVLCRPSG